MKFKSKQKGERISETYIYFEDTKKDEEIREKYNYCMEEVIVKDTIVKDCSDSYLGVGIYKDEDYAKNGILYRINISTDFEDINDQKNYIVKYTILHYRINNKDINTQKEIAFTYKVEYRRNINNTLNRFIKDLYYNGIIAEIYKGM